MDSLNVQNVHITTVERITRSGGEVAMTVRRGKRMIDKSGGMIR